MALVHESELARNEPRLTGPSPTKSVRRWPTELGHPVEDVTPDRGFSALRLAVPRLQVASNRTQFGESMRSSKVSSMATIRSSSGMRAMSALSSVVLPLAVALCRRRGYERLDRTGQAADDFPDRNQLAAFALHGSFSHVPQTRQGHHLSPGSMGQEPWIGRRCSKHGRRRSQGHPIKDYSGPHKLVFSRGWARRWAPVVAEKRVGGQESWPRGACLIFKSVWARVAVEESPWWKAPTHGTPNHSLSP